MNLKQLFIYGTLKQGAVNHKYLSGQRLVGYGRTRPIFRLHQLEGYPGMVGCPVGGRSIEGEIWEVDAACLKRLDRMEGIDVGLYARVAIRLLPPNDMAQIETYLYLGNVDSRRDLGTKF